MSAKRFRAFISYSQSDKRHARRLHRALEAYRLPRSLSVDGVDPKTRRLGRFFRDEDEMSAATDLGAALEGAIADSENLIVVASPQAGQSRWVNEEILQFRKTGHANRIFVVIVAGQPGASASEDPATRALECFPPALLSTAGADSPPQHAEPLGIDLRKERFARVRARLVAGLLRIPFDTLWQRDRRRARAKALLGTAAGAAVLALLIVGVGGNAISQQRQSSLERSATLSTASRAAADAGYDARALRLAVLAARQGFLSRASAQAEPALARAAKDLRLVAELHGHSDAVNDIAFSSSGERLATAGRDGTARLWDALSGSPVGAPMRHEEDEPIWNVVFSPDGSRLVTNGLHLDARLWLSATAEPAGSPLFVDEFLGPAAFSPDGSIVAIPSQASVWLRDPRTGKRVADPLRHDGSIHDIAFSPDGTLLATARGGWEDEAEGELILWDASATWDPVVRIPHDDQVLDLAFDNRGERIASASRDGIVRIWRVADGSPLGKPMVHGASVTHVAFSPTAELLVTAGSDRTARIWDLGYRDSYLEPLLHEGSITAAAFSPDGYLIATASEDGTARLWRAEDGAGFGNPLRHAGGVNALAFSADGLRLATASEDGVARLWDIAVGRMRVTPPDIEGRRYTTAISRDGTLVASTGGNLAQVWSSETGLPVGKPLQHQDLVIDVAFSPDQQRIATASRDGTARIWEVTTGLPVSDPIEHPSWVQALAFSPDGSRLATLSDRTFRLWDGHSGETLSGPLQHQHLASGRAISFSPEGKYLATGASGEVVLWDVESLQPSGEPNRHGTDYQSVTLIRFSPDGDLMAVAGGYYATLWDLKTRRPIGDPLEHDDGVRDVRFSADGKLLATASMDNTVRLWDTGTGASIGGPFVHDDPVGSVSFSPDMTRIATASDGFVQLWDAQTGASLGAPIEGLGIATFSHDGRRLAAVADVELAAALHGQALIDAVCARKFPLTHRVDAQTGQSGSAGRITAGDVEAAPVLAGLENEDVCAPLLEWDTPAYALRAAMSFR